MIDVRELLGDRMAEARAMFPVNVDRFQFRSDQGRSIPIPAELAPPPEPHHLNGTPKNFRPTHQIGKITAKGGRPASKAPSACDHSKFKAWRHNGYRLRCGGCKQAYNKSGAVA